LNDSLPVIQCDAGTGSNPDQIGEQKDPQGFGQSQPPIREMPKTCIRQGKRPPSKSNKAEIPDDHRRKFRIHIMRSAKAKLLLPKLRFGTPYFTSKRITYSDDRFSSALRMKKLKILDNYSPCSFLLL